MSDPLPMSDRRHPMRRLLAVLLVALSGCAGPPQPDIAEPVGGLPEGVVTQLLAAWEGEVCRYVDREGDGDPAVLSETTALHSRDALRPARITFGVLDAEAELSGRDAWDLQGLLVGKQTSGAGERYVFLVSIIGRSAYVPRGVQDIRLVGLSVRGGTLNWEVAPAAPAAVGRYRDTFRGTAALRFPADTDRFTMDVAGDRVSVREVRSGAEWQLQATPATPSRRSQDVLPVLSASNGRAADRCAR